MSDNRAYDPDEYFGRATPREAPDTKAEAAERLRQAIAYARLHAPELLTDDRKRHLDAIARELYGWPDDGSRRAYDPSELPAMARRLRRKAEILAAIREGRDVPEERGTPESAEPQQDDIQRRLAGDY